MEIKRVHPFFVRQYLAMVFLAVSCTAVASQQKDMVFVGFAAGCPREVASIKINGLYPYMDALANGMMPCCHEVPSTKVERHFSGIIYFDPAITANHDFALYVDPSKTFVANAYLRQRSNPDWVGYNRSKMLLSDWMKQSTPSAAYKPEVLVRASCIAPSQLYVLPRADGVSQTERNS